MRSAIATWRMVKNNAGEDIPPCSLLAVESRVTTGGYFLVGQPASGGDICLVSPPFAIIAATECMIPSDSPVKLQLDAACSAGDSIGPKSGQWTGHVGGGGFVALCDSFADDAIGATHATWVAVGGSFGYADPHNLTYTGEHTEAARTDVYDAFDGTDEEVSVLWHRGDPPADTVGMKITQALGVAYYHAGDKKIYQYVADFHYDASGRLVFVGPETRVEIDAAESC